MNCSLTFLQATNIWQCQGQTYWHHCLCPLSVSTLQCFDTFCVTTDLNQVTNSKLGSSISIIRSWSGGTSCIHFGQDCWVKSPPRIHSTTIFILISVVFTHLSMNKYAYLSDLLYVCIYIYVFYISTENDKMKIQFIFCYPTVDQSEKVQICIILKQLGKLVV